MSITVINRCVHAYRTPSHGGYQIQSSVNLYVSVHLVAVGARSASADAIVVCTIRGPRVEVSTAAFHARVRGSFPGFDGLKETTNVSSPSTRKTQYCGEPP